jgi:hypothetical protein
LGGSFSVFLVADLPQDFLKLFFFFCVQSVQLIALGYREVEHFAEFLYDDGGTFLFLSSN